MWALGRGLPLSINACIIYAVGVLGFILLEKTQETGVSQVMIWRDLFIRVKRLNEGIREQYILLITKKYILSRSKIYSSG